MSGIKKVWYLLLLVGTARIVDNIAGDLGAPLINVFLSCSPAYCLRGLGSAMLLEWRTSCSKIHGAKEASQFPEHGFVPQNQVYRKD